MVLEVNHIDRMVERIMSLKKIRMDVEMDKEPKKLSDREKLAVKALLMKIFTYIDYFNSLSDLSTRVFDVEFSKIPILNEFRDFLIPASVKMNTADLNCEEMLIKPQFNSNADLNLDDYLNLCLDFRALFKKDISDNVSTLDSFRKSVSWSEMASKACYSFAVDDNGKKSKALFARYDGDVPFIPIQISSFITNGYKTRYWNATSTEIIDDYVTRWLI